MFAYHITKIENVGGGINRVAVKQLKRDSGLKLGGTYDWDIWI